MKIGKKIISSMQKGGSALMFALLSKSVFAKDLLVNAMEGDVKDTLGSGAVFWKIFTLVSVVLATAAATKTHNPMVFFGVIAITFIPAFLIKTFVFG